MTPDKVITIGYIVDMLIKGCIALILAVAGFIFKDMHQSVQIIKDKEATLSTKVAVLESNYIVLLSAINKMDTKIDILIKNDK